jgi:hypothetical protein
MRRQAVLQSGDVERRGNKRMLSQNGSMVMGDEARELMTSSLLALI